MMQVINPRTGEPYARRVVLFPGTEVSDVVRVLTDRYGAVQHTVHPEGDTDAVYFDVER